MTPRRDKLPAKKKAAFFLGLGLAAVIAVGVWFLGYSFIGVFGRPSGSVANSEWVSWNVGTLFFGETTGLYSTAEKRIEFRYEERGGSIKIYEYEEVAFCLTRFGDKKLIKSDGSSVFYYKGGWEA